MFSVVVIMWFLFANPYKNSIFYSPWLFLCLRFHTAIRGMKTRTEIQRIKEERAKKAATKVAQKCTSIL